MTINYTHPGRTPQPMDMSALAGLSGIRTTPAMDMSALAGLSGIRTPRTRVLRKGQAVTLTSNGAARVETPLPPVPSLSALSALMRAGLTN